MSRVRAGRLTVALAAVSGLLVALGAPACGRYGPPTRRPPEPSIDERAPTPDDEPSERRDEPTAASPSPASAGPASGSSDR